MISCAGVKEPSENFVPDDLHRFTTYSYSPQRTDAQFAATGRDLPKTGITNRRRLPAEDSANAENMAALPSQVPVIRGNWNGAPIALGAGTTLVFAKYQQFYFTL